MPEWVVLEKEAGSKLLTFLVSHYGKSYSARAIKRAIENNNCQINGRTERFASVPVGKGDRVQIFLEPAESALSRMVFESGRIIFEDQDLLIYNKPAGINCDVAGIERILKVYCPSVKLVHRLDRDTTGVLILAKTDKSHELLLKQFKDQTIRKRYLAIVDGQVKGNGGVIDNLLGRKKVYSGQTIWGAVKKDGLRAHTEWKKIKSSQEHEASLMMCFPKTGRTHQIRVHMAEMGHPILGDFQYGKQFRCGYRSERYLLHAEQVEFTHQGKILILNASLPEDFSKAQNALFDIMQT